jgi:hypothetical protein
MNAKHMLKELVLSEESAENLPRRKLGKAPKLVHVRTETSIKIGLHPYFVLIIRVGSSTWVEHRMRSLTLYSTHNFALRASTIFRSEEVISSPVLAGAHQ